MTELVKIDQDGDVYRIDGTVYVTIFHMLKALGWPVDSQSAEYFRLYNLISTRPSFFKPVIVQVEGNRPTLFVPLSVWRAFEAKLPRDFDQTLLSLVRQDKVVLAQVNSIGGCLTITDAVNLLSAMNFSVSYNSLLRAGGRGQLALVQVQGRNFIAINDVDGVPGLRSYFHQRIWKYAPPKEKQTETDGAR